jgi:hypothetical protein
MKKEKKIEKKKKTLIGQIDSTRMDLESLKRRWAGIWHEI